jgi:hypothetical protein
VKSALRVFLGADEALAMITAGDRPLSWRAFPLPAGAEAPAVVSAVSTLRTLSSTTGSTSRPSR